MIFVSKYKEHKLCLIAPRYILDNFGNRQFVQGMVAEFHNNQLETNDPKMIELIKTNEWYGVDIKAVGDNQPVSEEAKLKVEEENKSAENTLTSCPYCTFNAKTQFGLRSHIRFAHKDKVTNKA